MKNNAIVTVLLVVIAAGAGFFGGMKYQQGKQLVPGAGFNGTFRQGINGRGNGTFGNRTGAGARQVVGQVVSQDASSATVQLADGSSRIVLFSGKTSFNKTSPGSQGDIVKGERIAVFGTVNSDGSMSAENVQINPAFRGPGNGTPAPSPAQ